MSVERWGDASTATSPPICVCSRDRIVVTKEPLNDMARGLNDFTVDRSRIIGSKPPGASWLLRGVGIVSKKRQP